jgi:hypothetical protein
LLLIGQLAKIDLRFLSGCVDIAHELIRAASSIRLDDAQITEGAASNMPANRFGLAHSAMSENVTTARPPITALMAMTKTRYATILISDLPPSTVALKT